MMELNELYENTQNKSMASSSSSPPPPPPPLPPPPPPPESKEILLYVAFCTLWQYRDRIRRKF